MFQTRTAKTAIDAVLNGMAGRDYASFRSFPRFAKAVREVAALELEATDEELAHLDEILEAAKASNGTLPLRISYAAHLAYHAADCPLERGA